MYEIIVIALLLLVITATLMIFRKKIDLLFTRFAFKRIEKLGFNVVKIKQVGNTYYLDNRKGTLFKLSQENTRRF